MKKMAGFMALALLAASVPAAAEETGVELKKIGEYEEVDWVYDGSQLIVDTDEGYAMMDIAGNMLTDAVYGSQMEYICGYVMAEVMGSDINSKGMMTEEGEMVIPFRYGDIKVLNRDWAVGLTLKEVDKNEQYDYESWSGETYWQIETAEIYYLPEQKSVANLERAAYKDIYVVGHRINIENRETGVISTYDSAFNEVGTDLRGIWDETYADLDYVYFYDSESGNYGIKDADGNITVEPQYDYVVQEEENLWSVELNELYGLIDSNGKVILPAEYEEFEEGYYAPVKEDGRYSNMSAGGYYCVIVDGKMGYVREGGVVTCEPTYAADNMENYGASALLTDMEGDIHIIAADGTDTVLEGYESIYALDYGAGFFYEVLDENYNSGMIDWHGNVIIPCEFANIELSGNGKYVLTNNYDEPYVIYELEYPVEMNEAELETEAETEGAE